jgi:hypothetical protein
VRELGPALGKVGAHLARRAACCREPLDPAQSELLVWDRHQLAVGVVDEAERRDAAAGTLRPLGRPDPLADPVAFELGEGGDDGQEQPRDAIARYVVGAAVEVEQEQADAARLESLDDREAVAGDRNIRSSLAATSVSPLRRSAQSLPPSGRSANGTAPETPGSTITCSSFCPRSNRGRQGL